MIVGPYGIPFAGEGAVENPPAERGWYRPSCPACEKPWGDLHDEDCRVYREAVARDIAQIRDPRGCIVG